MAGDEERAAAELGIAQGLAELVERGPRLGENLGGVEGEEDLHIDVRRLRLLDELRNLVTVLARDHLDLPRLEFAQLGVELLLLGLALWRQRIEAAGLDRGQPLDDGIGALHVLRLRGERKRESGEAQCGYCRHRQHRP